MKRNSGARLRTRSIAPSQNGGGRRPQVRSNTSGSTSIAMSQRTPSQSEAICSSSPTIASWVSGCA